MRVAFTMDVCVDCLIFIANGDLPEDQAASDAVVAGVGRETPAGGSLHLGGGENEETGEEDSGERGFSWRPCECCRSHLGGDRHEVVALAPNCPRMDVDGMHVAPDVIGPWVCPDCGQDVEFA